MQVASSCSYLNQLPSRIPEVISRGTSSRGLVLLRSSTPPPGAAFTSIQNCGLSQRRSITIDHLDGKQANRERVVILGSGWAGYTLARQLNSSKYQAVVVSPRSYFAFTPLLASTSVGTLEFRTALEPVRSKRTNVDFFQGWSDDVDFANKTVTVEEGVADPRTSMAPVEDRHAHESKEQRQMEIKEEVKKGKLFKLRYDKLIITVGSYSQTFGTAGVREHALFLKDIGDARKIRNRILACFEAAALPTTSDEMRKYLLNFAIVGGGPTGIEFSAELHDIIKEDLAKIYPELMEFYNITVYDVAPKVLPMFDKKLADYAMSTFRREGIKIKTSHHVQELRRGPPGDTQNVKDDHACFTLKVKEEGEVGVGMVVWSTGLMANPFIQKALDSVHKFPSSSARFLKSDSEDPDQIHWIVKRDPKTGSVVTDNRLRVILEPEGEQKDSRRAIMEDVYALGDCAILEGTAYPATAQVASQKAEWLAKRLNKSDLEKEGFSFKDMGVLAYLGNWNAIMQSGGGGGISGRAAWLIWRGAYLTKSVSIRNKILIPIYWFINWAFGRDISRF